MGLFDTFRRAPAKASSDVPASETIKSSPALQAGAGDSREHVITGNDPKARKKLVLFIGGPFARFQTLSQELIKLEPTWSCRWVENFEQAAAALESEAHFAAILSEELAGNPEIGSCVPLRSASLVRVGLYPGNDSVVSGCWYADGLNPLPVTMDARGMIANLKRLARVQEWMANAAIKKLLSQCRKLPVMSRLYEEVATELDSPNGSIDVVAHHVAKDPVMTAKVLQMINSACFALGRQINDPCEAVMFLGMGRTRSLILMAGTFSQFEDVNLPGFSLEQIWNHSLQVGTLAQIIALDETGDAKLGEAAFTSGLMHDMGKLILAANVPVMCAAVEQLRQSKQLSWHDAELQVLGTTHAELAACLLGTWSLPLPVLEAVAWHHCPAESADTAFTPLTAVHAANVFAREMTAAADTAPERFDHDYLLQTGLGDRRNVWRETCGLPLKHDEDAEHKRVRLRREAKVN